MGEHDMWARATPVLEHRTCSVFHLWARDDGRWEVSLHGEMLYRDNAPDVATAKLRAEEALRELLTKALSELGDLRKEDRCGYPYDDGVMSTVCFRARGHGGEHG